MVHSNIVIIYFMDPCMVYCNIEIVDPLMDPLVSELELVHPGWYTLEMVHCNIEIVHLMDPLHVLNT